MDFEITGWLKSLTNSLIKTFGQRLLFAGHTGSYARGEATEQSDIDVNIVLDDCAMEDLRTYRQLIRSMPHHEKACGFICGRHEIQAWPRHELFSFIQGCRVLFGTLEGLVDFPGDQDIADSIRNTAAAVYHEACHRFLYGDDFHEEAGNLKHLYKAAFFVLQAWLYLKERIYAGTKKELLGRLDSENKQVLSVMINWDSLRSDREKRPAYYFSLLKTWSSLMLLETKA